MNIFYLDTNPVLAARAHCDIHVNKMAFEGAQMLSTAVRYLVPAWHRAPVEHLLYAPTHDNHPCSIWVRQNWHNANWLMAMITELDNEHSRRFGTLTDHYQIANIAFTVLGTHARARYQLPHPTPPAQAMPDVFKNPADPVAAYRRYYRIAKGAIARWERGTAAPDWWRVEPLGTTSA